MTNSYRPQALADLACQALYHELYLSPKPGLVDPQSNGAHHDMTPATFEASIEALRPYFETYARLGLQHQGSPRQLFESLRQCGQAAERAMYTATQQVNTHKGANFSLALFLAAFAHEGPDLPRVCALIRQMTEHLIMEDLSDLTDQDTLSYGQHLYLAHGTLGIRGEAALGYPHLVEGVLPFLTHTVAEDSQHYWLQALVYLMATLEDGNLLHRGGPGALRQVQTDMQALLGQLPQLSKASLIQHLEAYDHRLIERHLSPGGAADLLSLAYFCQAVCACLPGFDT